MTDHEIPSLRIEPIESGLRLIGEIDASCIDSLSRHLNPLPGQTGDVTIQLDDIQFIDSSGLRVLIDAHQRAERLGRRVVMSQPSSVVTRLFEVSGLTGYLHLA